MKKFSGRRRKALNSKTTKNKPFNKLDLSLYEKCEICYELMPIETPTFIGQQNIKTLVYQKLVKCGHRFHQSCLQNYLKMTGIKNVNEQFNHNIQFQCPMENCPHHISI